MSWRRTLCVTAATTHRCEGCANDACKALFVHFVLRRLGRSSHVPWGAVTRTGAASRPRLRFTTQALLLHLGVLVLVLAAGLGLVVLLVRGELDRQFERRALGIAHAVAADPEVAVGVTSGPPSADGVVQR